LTHPVSSSMFCPSLFIERGEVRLVGLGVSLIHQLGFLIFTYSSPKVNKIPLPGGEGGI